MDWLQTDGRTDTSSVHMVCVCVCVCCVNVLKCQTNMFHIFNNININIKPSLGAFQQQSKTTQVCFFFSFLKCVCVLYVNYYNNHYYYY